MNTYLTDDDIKKIVRYLKSVLSEEKIKVIRDFEERGVHFSYSMGLNEHRNNMDKVWRYYNDKFDEDADKETLTKYKNFMFLGQWEYAGNLVKIYINNNHKKEHDIIIGIDLPEICDRINGLSSIKSQNKLGREISLKELIFADDFEEYLMNNFSKKSVNKELFKETERIADAIDKQYFGKRGEQEYSKYQRAVKLYMITGNRNLFHNMLVAE